MFNSIFHYLSQKAIFGGFCEKQNLNFPVEVWNSISNLGYIGFALILANRYKKDKIYSALLIWLGLSSFLYHSIFFQIFHILDLVSINLIISYSIFIILKLSRKKSLYLASGIMVTTAIFGIVFPEFCRVLTILIIIISAIFLIKEYKRKAIMPMSIMLLAFICWVLDASILCFPETPFINGHVIWHLLTAFGFYKIGQLIF